ncbi:PKD domain-containing protein [Candidatus Electronema sp. TJ]|uniref:PKD domain-containing protein n=1 Tax=Candidatus Electronema sp. TJ TaxID=3401573 RepID=UPI003AA8E08B
MRFNSVFLPASRLAAALACLLPGQLVLAAAGLPDGEFTLDADFDKGASINVVHDPSHDQLQLDDTMKPFDFIWIAVSTKGTVVKVDTKTGQVLAEYRTAPDRMGKDPSRTTVDKNGNVWVTNRAEGGDGMGSIVHIGLKENGQCVDRNGNGVIDTSTGQGDVRGWGNAGNADSYGGVDTAEDECILHYTRVNSTGARHVSVNKDNNVWVSGTGYRKFDLIDGDTGQIIRQESSVGYGGYGGLIDKNGVIWSARPMLRWDTALPLSGPNGGNWRGYGHESYGLCIDPDGNVWNTGYGDGTIKKFAPNGNLIGTYNQGYQYAQGCVADKNGHIWVAHSLNGTTVGHLLNNGTYIGTVSVGSGPTGVAVDADGKIWATNYYSRNASRINPNAGQVVNGVHVGQVDLTTVDLGGNLYNYSDMTGSTLIGAPDQGTWTVVHNAGMDDVRWNKVSWTADEPGDSSIKVTVAGSQDCSVFGEEIAVENDGSLLDMERGRCLRLTVSFSRSSMDEDGNNVNDTPVLYDIAVDAIPPNTAPVAAVAEIGDAEISLPVTMKITPQTLNLSRRGNWVKAHISANLQAAQEMEVVLDGSGSTDEDGDELSYDWTLVGPDGEIEVDDAEMVKVVLPAGNYTATLVVNDGKASSEPVEENFTLTGRAVSDMPSGSYLLNGVPQSESKTAGNGKMILSFDDDAVAQTVNAGQDIEMILTGFASGVDYIKVIK